MEADLPNTLRAPVLLQGSVRDEAGTPLSFVSVHLSEAGEPVAHGATDELGRYRLRVFGQGPFDLSASTEDLGTWHTDLDFSKPGDPTEIDLVLHPAISLQGRITSRDGAPLPGVIVQALTTDGRVVKSVQSDSRGDYRFRNLRPGDYRLRIHLEGRFAFAGERVVTDDATRAQRFQVDGEHTVISGIAHLTPFRPGTWRTYDAFDGPTANAITDIGSAADGTLWMATEGSGVWSFDGQRFVNLTTDDGLADDEVNGVTAARDGVMWFATQGGASRYHDGEWTSLTAAHGLADDEVNSIYEDEDGVLWFATQGGVSRREGDGFVEDPTVTAALAGVPVTDITRDASGTLWLATNGRGLWRYANGEMTQINVRQGLADTRVWCILEADDGVMWFGTDNGISRYDRGHFATFFTNEDDVAHNQISDIHQSRDGGLWFATLGGGVLRSDGEHFVSFATDDGLAHNTVGAIHEDFQGGVWFGSEDGSLSRYDRHGIVNLGGREGLQADRVAALATSSDGGVWIGTEQGLRHRRDGEFAILGRRRMPIGTLATFGSGVWVGVSGVEGEGGVWRYGESGLHSVAQGGAYQFQDMVNDLFLDDGGKLWVGTEGGVLALDGDRSESFTERQGLILDQVQAVGQDLAGLLYFGTSGRGVSVYDGLSFTVLTTADGLTDDHVTAIHTDPEGDLWFGTQGGLSRYDGSRFVNYTTRNSASAPSDDMHILITGELSVVNSEGIRLARLYPVTTVGEMGLITRQARSASVEVSKPSTLMVLQRSPFEALLRADPDLQIKIYRNIIDILAGKISGDNVRVRDYLVEKVDHQRELRGVRRRLETVQNLLLAETGLSAEEMETRIEEELVPAQMRVLIVDDEPGICQFVREALPGYLVDEASDGIGALKAVESDLPDLIITDIRMPHMDGPALLKSVRSKLPNVPIIALSGYVEAKDLEAFDFDGFIRKPFELNEFRSLVDEAVCGPEDFGA